MCYEFLRKSCVCVCACVYVVCACVRVCVCMRAHAACPFVCAYAAQCAHGALQKPAYSFCAQHTLTHTHTNTHTRHPPLRLRTPAVMVCGMHLPPRHVSNTRVQWDQAPVHFWYRMQGRAHTLTCRLDTCTCCCNPT